LLCEKMGSTIKIHVFKLLFAFCLFEGYLAFVNTFPGWRKKSVLGYPNVCLDALTERQEQFWEDVEEGLNDIENDYIKRGGNIDRIRRFGMR
jgi:hypothetical protein